jgi:thiaminase (transcriptional activator TenA)
MSALSDRLQARWTDEWERLHDHPFVRGLADGTLPLDAFRFYLEQNLQYLPEYARAIAFGAARSDDVKTMRIFAAELTNVLESEIPENRSLLQQAVELGAVDHGGADGMAPATVAYTSFLVATAARGGPLEIMAAIVPCTWSYGDIGSRLVGETREHPLYTDWIGFFGSPAYAEIVSSMRRDFDELGADLDEEAEAHLSGVFGRAVELERGFWDMAFDRRHWPDHRAAAR